MFDQLFVARAAFNAFAGVPSGLTAGAGAAGSLRDSSARDSLSGGSASATVELSNFTRRTGELNRELGRVAVATGLVNLGLKGARAIGESLASARELAGAIDAAPAVEADPPTPVSVTGSQITRHALSLVGTALSIDPVSITGTVALDDDIAATGQGSLSLTPIGATGSITLAVDEVGSVTGTEDVGSVGNFLVSTSISQGDTLTIDTGNGVETITFGLFGAQVNDAAELEQAIDAIDGVEASYTAEGYLTITADDAETDFTIGGSADIAGVFGIAEQAYTSTNLLSQGITAGETLTFDVNGGGVQTTEFGFGAGQVGTLAELAGELSALSGFSASIDGSNRLSFAASGVNDAIEVAGTVDAATVFGLAQTTYDSNDLLNQGIAQDETLTFQLDGQGVQTITFGTGVGEVSTISELNAELAGLSDITASVSGSNVLTFTASDAARSVTVGGTADIAGVLGVTPQTYEPFNLLDQGIAQGETLALQVGSGAVQTITFGSGTDEVSTLAELDDALGDLGGVTASLDGSSRVVIAASGNDDVTIGGSVDVATAFGIAAGTREATLAGPGAGETLTFAVNGGVAQEIAFGSGGGQVDTISELATALGDITGITAALDGQNRITVTAGSVDDTVEIGGTADTQTLFGLAPGTAGSTILSDGVLDAGDTLTFSVNGGTTQTITFGAGDGQIATLSDLDEALAGLTGLTASIDPNDRIAFSADEASDTIEVGGSANLAAAFGLSAVLHEPEESESVAGSVGDISEELAALNAAIEAVSVHVAGAKPLTGPNLIDGFTHEIRVSANRTDRVEVGGASLGLADLGLAAATTDDFSSDEAKTALLARIDAAIATTARAVERLENQSENLAARKDFANGSLSIIGDSVEAIKSGSLGIDRAERSAAETQRLLELYSPSSSNSSGALGQISGSAFAGDYGTLFSTRQQNTLTIA